jgi:RNA polymerase-binding transcription factor DksA
MDEVDLANDRAEQFNTDAVRAARAKMDAAPPSNGICDSCRDAIEPERLHANPAARLCCGCAAEEEADLKRRQKVGG